MSELAGLGLRRWIAEQLSLAALQVGTKESVMMADQVRAFHQSKILAGETGMDTISLELR